MSTELARRAADGDTGPEVSRWWCEAMRRHLDGDDLGQALRLDRASRQRECDEALRDAARLLSGEDGPWRCAGRLAMALRRYESRVAPMLARNPKTPIAPIDEALRRAFDTGQRIPTTQRNLYKLIR